MEKENRETKDGAVKTSSQRVNADEILRSIKILRNVTKIVKVAPFIYVLIYLLTMPLYVYCEGEILDIVDMAIYMSPLMVILLIIMSYSLKFCVWHRSQCLLPTISQAFVYVDTYIYEFGESAIKLLVTLCLFIIILSLTNTYFVFIKKPDLRRQGS